MSWDGIHHLIARAKAGDDDAWASLHEMVRPYLLNLGQRLLGPAWPHESVSDLTQSTWKRVLTGVDGFRGGEDDVQTGPLFRAWLRQTMKRVHANQQRGERTQRRHAPPGTVSLSALRQGDSTDGQPAFEPIADGSSVSAHLRREEQQALIQRVLDDLDDPQDRELIQLHFFQGRSMRSIAAERGVSAGTIGERIQDILDRLGRDLKDLQ
ncbi:MAG: RNA polymerase sigma factor [Isosphaerales bacterium]